MNLPPVRFTALADLTDTEIAALQNMSEPAQSYRRGDVIRLEGENRPALFLLLEGWAAGCVTLEDGKRQYMKLHLSGDIMGAPSLPLDRAAETLLALADARVARVSLSALGALFTDHPRLGALLFLAAQEERVILMDRLASIGRLDARQRIAGLFIHIHERLCLLGRAPELPIEMPLTQDQIADMLGLTPIHVNRTLRRMDADHYIRRTRTHVSLLRFEDLRALAGLPHRRIRRNPSWLPPAR